MANGMQRRPPTETERRADQSRRFKDLLHKYKGEIGRALPMLASGQALNSASDRWARIVLTNMNQNPALFECTETSVLAAVVRAAQLGLEPDGTLGYAYLIPYGRQCQLVIGYQGLMELANRSEKVKRIRPPRVVYDCDEFEVDYGLNERLHHRPFSHDQNTQAMAALGGEKPQIVAAYAIADLADGSTVFEVINRDFVNRIRKSSRSSSGKDSPWNTWEDQMWKKTVLKQLVKWLPKSAADPITTVDQTDGAVFTDLQITPDGEVINERAETEQPTVAPAASAATATEVSPEPEAPAKTGDSAMDAFVEQETKANKQPSLPGVDDAPADAAPMQDVPSDDDEPAPEPPKPRRRRGGGRPAS